MNNLLFSALAIALIYYLFFYLPSLEKANPPLKQNKETQTEPIKPDNLAQEKALESSIDELITEIRKLNQQIC
jgi:hypothetical protein